MTMMMMMIRLSLYKIEYNGETHRKHIQIFMSVYKYELAWYAVRESERYLDYALKLNSDNSVL